MHNKLETIPNEFLHITGIQDIYYIGNIKLLSKRKFSIIGSRKPNVYSQLITATIAQKISQNGGVVVSGGALGIDIISHSNSLPNTIMVSPSSLDIIYPQTNSKIIQQIQSQGLVISQYKSSYKPYKYSFLERNKLIISLGEIIIIPYADLMSGSMKSAMYALELGKKIYVIPHRMQDSKGTQKLIRDYAVEIIWDIDDFIGILFGGPESQIEFDEVLEFCKTNPFFNEAVLRFGDIIFEYELDGKIVRNNGRIEVV